MPQREIPDSPIVLIAKAELAQALGVSTYTIDDWLRKGKLVRPIPLAGNVHRWRVRDIEKWLRQVEARRHEPQPLRGRVKVQLLARLQPRRERIRLTDPAEERAEISQRP